MKCVKRSWWSKVIGLCLAFTIIDNGWVSKSHSCVVPWVAPVAIGAYEVIVAAAGAGAAALASTLAYQAYSNASNSLADNVLGAKLEGLGGSDAPSIPGEGGGVRTRASERLGRLFAMTGTRGLHIIAQTGLFFHLALKKDEKKTDEQDSVLPNDICTGVPFQVLSTGSVGSVDLGSAAGTVPAHVLRDAQEATEQIVYNLSVDWNAFSQRRACEAIYSSQAHAYQYLTALEQRFAKESQWIVDTTPTSFSVRTPDGRGYFNVALHEPSINRAFADGGINRNMELYAIAHDDQLRYDISVMINSFVYNAVGLVYGNFAERLSALMCVDGFYMSGVTFGKAMMDTQFKLYASHYHKDGSICIQSLKNMESARQAMLSYHGINHHHHQYFVDQAHCPQGVNPCGDTCKKTSKVNVKKIANNPVNQFYRQMVTAFSIGDMARFAQLHTTFTAQKRTKRELQEAQMLHEELQTMYQNILRHQESFLIDAYGIMHFNCAVPYRDPLYLQLSDVQRTQLSQDAVALQDFNSVLQLRQLAKGAMQKAWNIPIDAHPVVHQALYALVGTQSIPDRIDTINALAENPQLSLPEQKLIQNALFLSNGIIKDFADYDRAQSLQLPASILGDDHALTRSLLNHLVYAERVCEEILRDECAYGIECLRQALAATDDVLIEEYIANAWDALEIVVGDGTLALFNEQPQNPGDQDSRSKPKNKRSKQPKRPRGQRPPGGENFPPGSLGALALVVLDEVERDCEKALEFFRKTCHFIDRLTEPSHGFRPSSGHNFEALFARFGANINSEEPAEVQKIIEIGAKISKDIAWKLIEMGTKLPVEEDGVFWNVLVESEGELITTRGLILEGAIRFSTMFIQDQHVKP